MHGHKGIGFPRLYDFLLRCMTGGREASYRGEILDRAAFVPGDAVLDVGCGTGTQALLTLARILPGGSVTGLDINPRMVAAARRKIRRAGAAIEVVQGDATALPFGADRFDVVTITTVLHMIATSEHPACLAEAKRVLKPGGRLVLIDYAGKFETRRHMSARHGPHGRFDLHDLRGAVAEAGFESIGEGELGWLSLSYLVAELPSRGSVTGIDPG